MIDEFAAHLALRNRALALVSATTGTATLSATASGFARTAGSFLNDGFVPGMEIRSAGWNNSANNGVGVITAVTDLALTVSMFVVTNPGQSQSVTRPATVIEAADVGRTITAGLPSMRAWENRAFVPAAGIPYVEEDFVPATHRLVTMPAAGGVAEETGLYVLKWYGLPNIGIGALRKSVGALKALYAPGTNMVASADVVTVRADTAVRTGQVLQLSSGWCALVLTVPWRARSRNAIAA